MTEHIALLRGEILQLQVNLSRAEVRPGVKEKELENLRHKIKLKSEILRAVEAADRRMEEEDDDE